LGGGVRDARSARDVARESRAERESPSAGETYATRGATKGRICFTNHQRGERGGASPSRGATHL
jgi:hypothetical protein